MHYPLIVAHRGDVRSAPENTMPAFRNASEAEVDAIELDVRLTQDEQLVVFHDWSLKRTSNGDEYVNHYTLKELRSLDVGSWFGPVFQGERPPTLDQVFESLPRDYLVDVEMKVVVKGMKLIAQQVAETIARHCRWGITLVASFNPVALNHLRKMDPRIHRGYIWARHHPYPINARCFSPIVQAHGYDPAHDTYDPRLYRRFDGQGRRMLAWDIDFGSDLELMASARRDAVVADNLAVLVQQKRELLPTAV